MTTCSYTLQIENKQTYMKSFLSEMKSSAAETLLKHWLVVMKNRAPILHEDTGQRSQGRLLNKGRLHQKVSTNDGSMCFLHFSANISSTCIGTQMMKSDHG